MNSGIHCVLAQWIRGFSHFHLEVVARRENRAGAGGAGLGLLPRWGLSRGLARVVMGAGCP
jgi:hypothetical protein